MQGVLHMSVPELMYVPSRSLSALLFFPGLAYEAVVRLRNSLYSSGLFTSRRLPGPVVSIGNLTLGGTGKTPLSIYVGHRILDLGYTPVFLTRGYGRQSRMPFHIVEPGSVFPSPSFSLGDEPTLLQLHVPQAWLGIAANRYLAGCRIAERETRAAFILDDGFQHRQLQRDLDIVVVDPLQPFGSNRVFPRGSLREPQTALRRCQAVVINGRPGEEASEELEGLVRMLQPEAAVFHCTQKVTALIPLSHWQQGRRPGSDAGEVESVFLVAAVGNPERFRADIQKIGIQIMGARYFRDHAHLNAADWISCSEAAAASGARAIVMTEKDAVKLQHCPAFPVVVAVQTTEMAEQAEFDNALVRGLGGRSETAPS